MFSVISFAPSSSPATDSSPACNALFERVHPQLQPEHLSTRVKAMGGKYGRTETLTDQQTGTRFR